MIYNIKSDTIPPVRRDVAIIPISDNGRNILYFNDPLQYVEEGFALDAKVEPILSLINGIHSVDKIVEVLDNQISGDDLLHFIQLLDQNLILESPFYEENSKKRESLFENSDVREPALVNQSYPNTSAELTAFLDDYLQTDGNGTSTQEPQKALYAPHIDLRVGQSNYKKAFSTLHSIKPKKVVILATSHYSGHYGDYYADKPFIGSNKNFTIPGRTFKTDQNSIEVLENNATNNGFTTRDRAHRVEHSIETHLLLASHYWKHEFTVLPILVGGFDELFYKNDGDMGSKLKAFTSDLQSIDDDDTFFLISGDLSHVGKKFGDVLPAEKLRHDVETFDKAFMNYSSENKSEELINYMANEYDPYRVCGFPPMLTFLKTFPDLKGEILQYDWWDEKERESAVSYSSIIF